MKAIQWMGAAGALLLGGGFAVASAQGTPQRTTQAKAHASAQSSTQTDSRWYPWLGCWAADSASSGAALECIAPASTGSSADAISMADGKIVERDRLDPSGRPHAIRVDGCNGTETAHWSADGRRFFLNSTYSCGSGITGSSARLFSLLPTGEWLDVTDVQSGNGSIVNVVRRHPVPVPASAPRAISAALEGRRLAYMTARANAASPITVDEVIEAVHATSAPAVSSWLAATRQHFNLDSRQLTTLTQANVPPSVLRAMLGADAQASQNVYGSTASDEYLNTPVYSPGGVGTSLPVYGVSPIMECPALTCYTGVYGGAGYPMGYGLYDTYPTYVPYPVYTAPLIVHRGGHERFGRPNRPIHPVAPPPSRSPVGVEPPPSRTPVVRRPH